MFGHTFYHGTIRKYVTLFGTLFNDVYINRPDPDHNQTKTVKVPIAYGPKEKTLARLTADPQLNRMPAIVLPRMSFEIKSMRYAPERKLNTIHKRVNTVSDNPDMLRYQYNPVPYDIDFELSVMVKNADDGTRIIEQILPFFTPEWTTTVELIPDMNIVMDIPVVLTGITPTDQYEGSFEERRVLTWDLSFTLKGYIFGPVRKSGVIKFANTNLFTTLTSNAAVHNINVVPGLTANGTPTTDANNSVDASLINADDDFGYIITQTDL